MSTEVTKPKTCKKVNRTIDVRMVCDPPSHLTSWICERRGSPEYWKRVEDRYESWIKELEEFMRDHRSRDGIGLGTERVMEEQCNACGGAWETDTNEDTGKTICACCGAEVETETKEPANA
jgi:hypothetical protein